jgi:hypothetical protein
MQWGGYSRVPSSGLDAADPPISTPQLYVVAVHHLGGFSKGFLIILAGYGCRDAFNVIVPRQGIKPILWHVDLLSFPNRPINAEFNIFARGLLQDPAGRKICRLMFGT